MDTVMQVTVQNAIQKLIQYGFKECTQEVNNQCGEKCLYVFERTDDEDGLYYGCETVDDLFVLLSLVEASASEGS
jgi:hypothetical protein